MSALAPALQAYFIDRLIAQRDASPNTVGAYKTAFRLLLGFASGRTGKTPTALDIADLDAPLIGAFLAHLEQDRHNSAATRNNRLAAIHSLFAYLALHHPEHAASIQRVLAIPAKRVQRNLVTYLTDAEVDALVGACDLATWSGRRDHAMFVLTVQAGLRISELAGLTCQDITLTAGANVHTIGKGRKERRTPLVPETRAVLKAWLKERGGEATDALFPTVTGGHLTRDAIEHRLALHVALASAGCPSLRAKRVTMHTLRHTAAMRLLLVGNDVTVIALWLGHYVGDRRSPALRHIMRDHAGDLRRMVKLVDTPTAEHPHIKHEQIATTNIYLHADMTHKQRAIDKAKPLTAKPGRYQPPDSLLAFLEAL